MLNLPQKEGDMINIAVVNQSTAVKDTDVATWTAALQTQVTRDFFPVWGVAAQLTALPNGQNPPAGSWALGIFDNADQADALGYHDITPDGLPLGKVFAKTTLDDGGTVSVTASHELLEMLGDPDINLIAELDDPSGAPSKFYAYEVCDACEDDQFGYKIDGVLVSDFVYPAYFESFRKPNSTQFDYSQKITAPFTLLAGGYISVLDLSNLAQGWQQLTPGPQDRKAMRNSRARIGSRRERRRLSRSHWNRSEYKQKAAHA
jgi:hypothetical protein